MELDWINPALTFTDAEEFLSFGSMMLLAQALGTLWDRSNLSEIIGMKGKNFI